MVISCVLVKVTSSARVGNILKMTSAGVFVRFYCKQESLVTYRNITMQKTAILLESISKVSEKFENQGNVNTSSNPLLARNRVP